MRFHQVVEELVGRLIISSSFDHTQFQQPLRVRVASLTNNVHGLQPAAPMPCSELSAGWSRNGYGVVAVAVALAAAADVTAAAVLGLLRDREPLLRRSYPNKPTYQGYPEGGAARDPVPKAANARR